MIGKVQVPVSPTLIEAKLKVQSNKLYDSKYMMASTQITNTGILA